MAEFCKKCAPKYGHEFEGYPCFCEGCGEYFDKKESWFSKFFRSFYLMLVSHGLMK